MAGQQVVEKGPGYTVTGNPGGIDTVHTGSVMPGGEAQTPSSSLEGVSNPPNEGNVSDVTTPANEMQTGPSVDDNTFAANPSYKPNPEDSEFVSNPAYKQAEKPKPASELSQERNAAFAKGGVSGNAEGIGLGAAETVSGMGETPLKSIATLDDISYNLGEKAADTLGIKDPVKRAELHAALQPVLPTLPDFARAWLHEVAGDNEQASGPELLGQGISNIGEFILGDEALQALPYAVRLERAAKAMKTIQGSPRLANALRVGARITSLAALHGTEAGAVQGVQSELHNPGDQAAAWSSAKNMAITGGLLDAPMSAISSVIGKGGQAANTIDDLLSKVGEGTGAGEAGTDMRPVEHWSYKKGMKVTDPNATQIGNGAETKRPVVPGTQFYEPGVKEPQIQARPYKYSGQIDYNKMYDRDADPLNIQTQAQELTQKNGKPFGQNVEELIKQNGFDGYRSQGVVKSFAPVNVSPAYRDEKTAYSFVSPNVYENLGGIGDAQKQLSSKEQGLTKNLSQRLSGMLGLDAETKDSLGNWKDGAENSTTSRFDPSTDPDAVDYHTALMGRVTRQKAVMSFHPGEGDDSLFRFHVPSSEAGPASIAEVLDKNGIENRTLIPTPSGYDVVVSSTGGQLRDAVKQAAEETGAGKVLEQTGTEKMYGSWNDRAAGQENISARIAELEAKHPEWVKIRHAFETDPDSLELTKNLQFAEGKTSPPRSKSPVVPTRANVNSELASKVNDAFAPQREAAQEALNQGNDTISQAGEIGNDLARNAPTASEITQSAQKYAKDAHDALGTNYQAQAGAIKKAASGTTVDFAGSPLQKAAQTIAQGGQDSAAPLDQAFSVTRPGSAKANALVDALSDTEGTLGINDKGEPTQLTADHLLFYEKKINKLIRNTGWMTDEQNADRDIYFELKDGIHDTLQQLAEKSGKPDLVNQVTKMNTDYRNGIQPYQNADVKAALQGNSNNIAKRFMGGETSIKDIQAFRKAIGEESFGKFSDDSLQRTVADSVDPKTGELSFQKLFSNWNRIPSEVRKEMFGKSIRAGVLQDAISQVQNVNALGTIPNATAALKDIDKSISQILGNGDITSLLKDPERVKNLAQVVGPENMADLGKMIMANQLREAATTATGEIGDKVDTTKLLDFAKSLKDSPEVKDAFFRPTPEAVANYNKLMAGLQNVDSVKNAVKYGILAPSLAVAGGMAGHAVGSYWLGHTLAYTFAGVMATMAGERAPVVKKILEDVANSPKMWGALKALNNPTLKSTLAPAVVGTIGKTFGGGGFTNTTPNKSVYADAANSLGGK
jgi:hypothetical protein